MTARRVLATLVALVLTTAFAPAAASAEPAPPGDAFSVPPSPLPAGKPGDVIRWRPSNAGPRTASVDAWQVMYLSTNALGQPDAVTGTVLVPKNADRATAPIVAFAPGTHGPAFACTPSAMIAIGAFYEQPGLDDLLDAGYAVAVPDYEGYQPAPKTTYVVGRSEGPAVIDAVRAAQRLGAAGLSASAKVVFRGYSQGGGAAAWAGELQPSYAPELNLVGIAAGGVPADLVQVTLQLDGKFGFGVFAYALLGLDQAYPELQLDSFLSGNGRAKLAEMKQSACTFELLTTYANQKIADYTTGPGYIKPAWVARLTENKLGGSPPRVPVFLYHATGDQLVQFAQADSLHKAYCAAGVQETWKTYDTDHITLVYTGNADVLAFVKDRIAGKPATASC
ncbi:lipase [Amycolatopsis mediterranei S699]|uniref:Lipase n=3 Tax=Amycolatopsis mediterranei TaxID=33910 RepID=A0A0H3DGR9_AMYMU|nr:lipase family protein [Amycolatopsis mediterranei]ADJ49313.1 lipase [Amycolatopsis mediterranei U32]AEK46277.1 lipase [Amycolatopsis mediterranei S699]AFO81021.1 lipase [Amycolatopsis mediterranei S699]AGT88149.1 lipase [Amycolatopsis mediterranei RB]KDO09433.1 lipase [Amycolatopsis mediterranei]